MIKKPTLPPSETLEKRRKHYFDIAHSKGYNEAITLVHQEIGFLEPQVFDHGYDPERFKYLQKMRDLARELYTLKIKEDSQKYFEQSK